MRYAFTFDASACTGCKTCQVACKDAHDLPPGLLWRRVYEVSGGGWERRGAAWANTVFAYNVSVACNHCADPACVAACPTGACSAREDGIVSIDSSRCAGCEYCAWSCPYSAPKYSRELGYVTKCDFCRDLLDEGLSPACVAACPMRALDVTAVTELPSAAHPFPLPPSSRTQPRIVVKPHAAMANALPKQVANREEIDPPGVRPTRTIGGTNVEDVPLVLFTLFAQAASGVALLSPFAHLPTVPLLAAIGVLILLAACSSFLHLGTVSQAWRTPANVRSSALSREIAALGLFTAAWLAAWLDPPVGRLALAAGGLLLVYTMTAVYAIDEVPGWNSWRTRAAFVTSAVLLGIVATLAIGRLVSPWFAASTGAALFADQFARRRRFYGARRLKVM